MTKLQSLTAAIFVCLAAGASAATIPGDATRGEAVFQDKGCAGCHALDGSGGRAGPDLAKLPSGRFVPSALARSIWNHSPKMWAQMEKMNIEKPVMSVQDAADLYAYLFSFRYSEEPGDPEEGQRTFDAKGCIACHAQGTGGALPVTAWSSVNNPVQLARSMWNHAPVMDKALPAGGTMPTLTAREMEHLLAYVRKTPGIPEEGTKLDVASAETGETLFRVKGCADCHTAEQPLSAGAGPRSMTELATEMWNHAPRMRGQAKDLRPEEMTRLVGYLWSIQYFEAQGDPQKGLAAAAANGCIECHGDPQGNTPRFSAYSGKMDTLRFISGTWNHGIGMWNAIQEASGPWPQLEGSAIADLVAYINSL